MEILVTNAWHDDNRGDMALVHSTIALLKEQYPNAKIRVISMIPEGHKYWGSAHTSLNIKYPDIEVIASPLPMEVSGVKLKHVLKLAAAFFSIFMPFFSKWSGFASYVKSSDLVVSVGGHYLFTYNNNFKSLFRLLRLTQPFTLAQHYQKPVVLFSQSMGPFQGGLCHKIIKNVFGYAKCIVRESLSQELIKSLVPSANTEVKPDSAFYLSQSDVAQNTPAKAERYAVFTLREPMKGNIAEVRQHFMQQLKYAAEQLIAQDKVDVIYAFPHVLGPIVIEDDRQITRDFVSLCNHEKVVLFDQALPLDETLALYKAAKFTIGTRFHSVVFSIAQNTPAVAIAYYGPKAQGIMKYIGMEELCFDIAKVKADELVTAVEKCLELSQQGKILEQRDRLTAELQDVSFND